MFSVSLPAPEHRTTDNKAELHLSSHGLHASARVDSKRQAWSPLDCKPFRQRTRNRNRIGSMICASRSTYSLAGLVCSAALFAGAGALAADLPLPPYIRLPAPSAMPPPIMDYKLPRVSEEAVQETPSIEQHNSRPSDSVASVKAAPLIAAPTEPVVQAPLPAIVRQRIASADSGVHKAPQAEPYSTHTDFVSFLRGLSILALGFIAALIGLLALPSVLRGFDALLAAPLACDGSDASFAHETNATGDDLQAFAQSELTAADIRKQTEVLRALKDTLDAEMESVRATIRRERAPAQAKDSL
jgi:hypothetical protein